MQEQNVSAPITPERNAMPSAEVVPQRGLVERAPESPRSREVAPAKGDTLSQAGPVAQFAPVNLPQPIVVDPQDVSTTNDVSSTAPAVADDVDVIEKVWVEKAKSIVKQTKDDPYLQEQQVSMLQDDYQMKRYGKDKKNR